MNLDPKAFAELRASWAAIEENASKAAEQIIPHAQACARSLDALKPELLGVYQRAIDEVEATLARALPQGMGEPGRTYTARDCLDGIRRAQGGRE
jgi:hypothetical protein